MLGFPEKVAERFNKPTNAGEDRISITSPVIISAEKVEDAFQKPSSVPIDPTKFPRFIGRINVEIPFNIKGMSGGPIFGLTEKPDGTDEYTVVALQSRWIQDHRIIFGCPLRVFGDFISKHEAGLPMTQVLASRHRTAPRRMGSLPPNAESE
jgi:hypothetical protein